MIHDGGTDNIVIFSDAGSEYDGVYTVHNSDRASDIFDYGVAEDLKSESSSCIAASCRFIEITEIRRNTGDTENAGLLVDDFHYLLQRQVLFMCNKFNTAWVDITGTGSHNQTFQWGQSHGGINGFAAVHSGKRRTVAQMADNNLQIFRLLAENLCGTQGNISV